MKKEVLDQLNLIAQTIYDKKGINILALDVEGLSSITDSIVIAEGNVDRHVMAIAHGIMTAVDERPVRVEGMQTGDWVVLDYVEIMVHLFMPGMREKYALEKLWKGSQIIDCKIDLEQVR
jgi:ribosome-associated protein